MESPRQGEGTPKGISPVFDFAQLEEATEAASRATGQVQEPRPEVDPWKAEAAAEVSSAVVTTGGTSPAREIGLHEVITATTGTASPVGLEAAADEAAGSTVRLAWLEAAADEADDAAAASAGSAPEIPCGVGTLAAEVEAGGGAGVSHDELAHRVEVAAPGTDGQGHAKPVELSSEERQAGQAAALACEGGPASPGVARAAADQKVAPEAQPLRPQAPEAHSPQPRVPDPKQSQHQSPCGPPPRPQLPGTQAPQPQVPGMQSLQPQVPGRPQVSVEEGGELYVVVIATYVSVYPRPDEKSTPVQGRLMRNEQAMVFEWDESRTWRRCSKRRSGRGDPLAGWVKVTTWKYGDLMKPVREAVQLDRLCKGDTTGVLRAVIDDMAEENVQSHVPEMLRSKRTSRLEVLKAAPQIGLTGYRSVLHASDGRLVLGRARRRQRPACTFRRVLVMGPHHTCTTALTREVEAQFNVEVVNNYDAISPEARPANHKHLVLTAPPDPQDAFIICLVKEPCFWLQSLTRNGATYAIRPVSRVDPMYGGGFEDLEERHVGHISGVPQGELLDELLRSVEFMGSVFPYGGALAVWDATVRSYFDESIYPLWRTAVVRCEDFLFSFEAVMQALSRVGLERRQQPPPPVDKPAKGGAIHHKTRSRSEAIGWYSHPPNRYVGLETRHIDFVWHQLGQSMLNALDYGPEAVANWTAERNLFIVGSWTRWEPMAMVREGSRFTFRLRIGAKGWEVFQLLLYGDWDAVFYPSVEEAGLCGDYKILGPDANGHGKNWVIGRAPNDLWPNAACWITADVNPDGKPVCVSWAF